jgi:hypothetical protein
MHAPNAKDPDHVVKWFRVAEEHPSPNAIHAIPDWLNRFIMCMAIFDMILCDLLDNIIWLQARIHPLPNALHIAPNALSLCDMYIKAFLSRFRKQIHNTMVSYLIYNTRNKHITWLWIIQFITPGHTCTKHKRMRPCYIIPISIKIIALKSLACFSRCTEHVRYMHKVSLPNLNTKSIKWVPNVLITIFWCRHV